MINAATALDRIEARIRALLPEGPANQHVSPPGRSIDPQSLPDGTSDAQATTAAIVWAMDQTIPACPA